MAITDILTTAQRKQTLLAAKKDIDAALLQCVLADKAFARLNSQSGYVNFQPRWDEVQSHMAQAKTAAEEAATKIGTLTGSNNGFVYKYKWEVGKAGVETLGFTFGFDLIGCASAAGISNEFTSTAAIVVADGDKILVDGTASNDGIWTVDIASTTAEAIATTTALTAESCTTPGASVTLFRRGT